MQLALDGLYEQNKYHHDLLQLSTRLIVSSGCNAKAAITAMNKAWPVSSKKSSLKISERAKEQLRQLREADALNRQKQKYDARRSSDTGRG